MHHISAIQIVAVRSAEHRFARLWTECQNCAGMLQGEVYCARLLFITKFGFCHHDRINLFNFSAAIVQYFTS